MDKHPKEVESLQKTEQARLVREAERMQLKSRIDFFRLKFVHIHMAGTPGGVTVAYRPSNYQGAAGKARMWDVSQAVCNGIDSFDKEKGRFYSAKNFANGHRIVVRVPEGKLGVPGFLREMFCWQLGYTDVVVAAPKK